MNYLQMVRETRVYPDAGMSEYGGISYCAMGLAGEVGEVLNQVKKVYRDDGGEFTADRLSKLKDELGDVLWYITALADELDISLSELKTANADKLLNRKANDTIHGDRRGQGNIAAVQSWREHFTKRDEPGMARPVDDHVCHCPRPCGF